MFLAKYCGPGGKIKEEGNRSFSTNFTAGTGMLSIWVMKTMHAGIFLAK
jgi:hypothetical protein